MVDDWKIKTVSDPASSGLDALCLAIFNVMELPQNTCNNSKISFSSLTCLSFVSLEVDETNSESTKSSVPKTHLGRVLVCTLVCVCV